MAPAPAGEPDVQVHGAGDLTRAAHEMAVAVLRDERKRASVTLTFVGKQPMRRLNRTHLGHDYATDVISFALPGPRGDLAVDVYICRAVAAQNARANAVPVREELLRLVTHGTLHGLGWDHPAGAGRQQSPMWRRQERYVARYA